MSAKSIGLFALSGILSATTVGADGIGDIGGELAPGQWASPRTETTLDVHGYFRARGDALYNLDLDRGPTPSGTPIFPVPVADPSGQTLYGADTRFRTDLVMYPRGVGASFQLRVDVLDNLALGSTPIGKPADRRAGLIANTPGQQSPDTAFAVKRAFAEVAMPFGVLAVGRMGAHWGLGMVNHGGDCFDCDGGDSADRLAFVTSLVGHTWAVAYDFSATGPFQLRTSESRPIDIEPSDNVHTVTMAVVHNVSERARRRRRAAGKASMAYGASLWHRWQDNDVPGDYLGSRAGPLAPADIVPRGYRATSMDVWARLTAGPFEVAAEAAYIRAGIDQLSVVPGVVFNESVTANQIGIAVESDYQLTDAVDAGLDAGFASGDSAPGFGAFAQPGAPATQPGDIDGPQASLTGDTTVDNFRFHPDYHIDRILFREIIGAVTDAVYVKPHVTYRLLTLAPGTHLALDGAIVVSWAAKTASTPGQTRFLGVEIDTTLSYRTRDGFVVGVDYAFFQPGAAFDNASMGLVAASAQLLSMRLGYVF